MTLKKKTVTGMRDILPKEMEIRDYVLRLMKETYRSYGFHSIETPCVEHIENLSNKQGGENEKLIFKILKRGEKLNLESAKFEDDLVDSALRYDLTVPLARYYSEHMGELPSPFKAMQMGNVWRADRPQKGRYRQFMQCDIDVLGESSTLAEIELIIATTTFLGKLDFKSFTIRINNRKILKAMAKFCGFDNESYDKVFIILDKMDKIGLHGVEKELVQGGFSESCVKKYTALFEQVTNDKKGIHFLKETLGDVLDDEVSLDMEHMITSVEKNKGADFNIIFDPTLVRGMSYYTGTIFEISMNEFGGSVGGGGRYDEMIKQFTGVVTPACGFSVGFERIVMLLLERDYKIPVTGNKKAYLLDKKIGKIQMQDVFAKAKAEREAGIWINIVMMKKNKKFQKEQLKNEGYDEIIEFYMD